MQRVVCGLLSSDWMLTESLSGIQSSSPRETNDNIFQLCSTSLMFAEIIITHASCTVQEKKYKDILIFFYLFQKTGFDISCKLSSKETVCMKCQTLFSEEKKYHQILVS